jgi:hypothetical protein
MSNAVTASEGDTVSGVIGRPTLSGRPMLS